MNTSSKEIDNIVNELKNSINDYQDVVKSNSSDVFTKNEQEYNNQLLFKLNDINEKLSILINHANKSLDEKKYYDISGGCSYNG